MAVTINADNGVSSGSAGLKQTADSTGVLALQTNGTTAVTVNTSQNVGIGTTSPTAKLDVSGTINSNSSPKFTSGINVWNTASNYSSINFYNSSALTTREGVLEVQYGTLMNIGSDVSIPLLFRTNGSERMRIDSSGNVGIGTSSPATNFVLSTSAAPVGGDNLQNMQVVYTGTAAENCGYTAKNYYGTSQFFQWNNNGTRLGNRIITNGGSGVVSFTYGNDTEGMRLDGSGNLLVNTTTAQTGAKLAVTGGIQGTIQSGTAVNSTSGTSISFTSIPSWVKRITVMLNGVSTNGTSFIIIQLGTGATPTYTTSGYVSGSVNTTATTGMLIWGGSAADIRVGSCVLTNFGNNIWNSMAAGGYANGAGGANAGGYVSLGATLTAVRITTINGTDTFDAGSINILYEG